MEKHDKINHPSHYVNAAVTLEPIELCQRLSFCLGNACKYLIRAGSKKGESEADDLKKARWYLERNTTIDTDYSMDIDVIAFVASKFAERNVFISALFSLKDNKLDQKGRLDEITIDNDGAIKLIEKRLSEIEQKEGLKVLWKGN